MRVKKKRKATYAVMRRERANAMLAYNALVIRDVEEGA